VKTLILHPMWKKIEGLKIFKEDDTFSSKFMAVHVSSTDTTA
jgi:hypothetical protein